MGESRTLTPWPDRWLVRGDLDVADAAPLP